jgi:DNA primase
MRTGARRAVGYNPAMAFRDDIKLQVQQSTNIVDLIGEQLMLKHKGREFAGLCPFHEDRNPSMYVSPVKQIFHCFVCGAGGDVFGWMMKYHKMTFPEALRFLAERAGIKIEETREQGPGPSERQAIGEANGLALMHFQKLFRHPQQGAIARAYIEKRQIPPALVEAFQIGYAPDGWDGLTKTISANKWNQRAFELAGLISPRDRDRDSHQPSFYDRLRHRVIFPICDGLGRPIAFGGRKIREEDEPKYLNSPETALFHKSRTLYGLHLAKKAMIDSRTAIIVEGYTDVIGCHVLGTPNAVATLGTALTAEHVKELRKYADRIILVFDADIAGEKAADRGTDAFLSLALEQILMGQIDISFARVPGGKDPGDLMSVLGGAELWKKAIAEAIDVLSFQLDLMKRRMDDAKTITATERLAEDYLRKIAGLGPAMYQAPPLRRWFVVKKLAQLLGMNEVTVNNLLKQFAPVKKTVRPGAAMTGAASAGRANSGAADENAASAGKPGPFSEASSLPDGPHSAPYGDADNSGENATSRGVTNNPDPVNTAQPEKSQHSSSSYVASQTFEANIGLVRAERQFMGCLLREPGLFHMTLSDGRMLDEALTPAEMVTPQGRELFGLMYERLSQGRELSLAAMLGEMAERGQEHLASLATQIERELDAMVGSAAGAEASVPVKLLAAAEKLCEHHRTQVQQDLPVMVDSASPDEALLKQMEMRKAKKSPLNIMRC